MLKFKPQFFFFLLFFLICLAFYILGPNVTLSYICDFFSLIEFYLVYINILVLIFIIYWILYCATTLYTLHIYSVKAEKGEKIRIPKALPDFVINQLKFLKLFSNSDAGIKEIKRTYYAGLVLFSISALIMSFFIYLA